MEIENKGKKNTWEPLLKKKLPLCFWIIYTLNQDMHAYAIVLLIKNDQKYHIIISSTDDEVEK